MGRLFKTSISRVLEETHIEIACGRGERGFSDVLFDFFLLSFMGRRCFEDYWRALF